MDTVLKKALELGAYKASIIDAKKLVLDAYFREMCKANACGKYGKCYQCPPYVGEIEDLINHVRSYSYALVYQTVYPLEDSYDFEGMIEAGKRHNKLTQMINDYAKKNVSNMNFLHLGAGGCKLCETCAAITNEPCRFPKRALSSLEAYGINVSKLAESANMNYINGKDTVTYFSVILY